MQFEINYNLYSPYGFVQFCASLKKNYSWLFIGKISLTSPIVINLPTREYEGTFILSCLLTRASIAVEIKLGSFVPVVGTFE